MARKVIIDCDPGIDDAVALCLALFDPRLEVVAVTATAGNVSAQQASRNVQTIIDLLDPARHPRIGAASGDAQAGTEGGHIHGEGGLGNASFPVAQLHHPHPSEKIICDEVHSAPDEVTMICLGPLTNLAVAFQRDPGLSALIDRVIIMGGSVDGVGNVTPSAEFNIHCDPVSARSVFQSPTTKTLIPLDVTRQVPLTLDFINDLPGEDSRAGQLLHATVPYLFRSHHQLLGQESIYLHDAVALAAAVQPDMFQTEYMAGDVETCGELTSGTTVFDRRTNATWRNNMEVAVSVDADSILNFLIRGLAQAGRKT